MATESPLDDVQRVTSDFIFGTLSATEELLSEHKAAGVGLRHQDRTDPALPVADQPVSITCTVGVDLSVATMEILFTTDGSLPGATSPVLTMHRTSVEWDDLNWSYIEAWNGVMPPEPAGTLVSYRVVARTVAGDVIWADADETTGEPGLFAYWLGSPAPPEWTADAIIYHVFVDRFAPDPGANWNDVETLNDFWGGTIEGLRTRIPYLLELGVNCLWLSPIFPSPTHHGYDTSDYFGVEPRLGTMEQFRQLLVEIHAAGMRVILDLVANHCSNQHPFFQRALDDPASPERDLFSFDSDGGFKSFYNVDSMPEWALDREPARRHLLDAANFWLDLGVDGYRLDYAMGPSHAFWAAFRQTTKTGKTGNQGEQTSRFPQPLNIGEITTSAARIATYEGRLDGALDFLLLQQFRAFFAFDLIDAEDFGRFLERHLAYFDGRIVNISFLDNHDMNRFLWVVRGDKRRLRLAALLQFLLPAPPIIYYGTEVGLSQNRDLEYPDGSRKLEESRTPMPWDDDQDTQLRDYYRRLIRLRRSTLDLRDARLTYMPSTTPGLLSLNVGTERTVLLNRSERSVTWNHVTGDDVIEFATEMAVQTDGSVLTMPPMSGCLVRRQ
jgi:glycosidase